MRRPTAARHRRTAGVAAMMLLFALIGAMPAQAAGSGEATHPALSPWRPLPVGATAREAALRGVPARRLHPVILDEASMKARLASAPLEGPADAGTLVVSLPAPGGGFERFAVVESPVVAPELAARFPFVTTYRGQGMDDPAATARFDLGRTGFHAQVLSPNGDWYVDPAGPSDGGVHVSYFARHLENTHGQWIEPRGAAVVGGNRAATADKGEPTPVHVVGDQLRTYRLALAADGEYSAFHGGTVPLVHNALVTAVNRVSGIYERDLAIRLQLVPNNDELIYLNPATDPYTNDSPSTLLTQNQANIDGVIGDANYDIGHVFTTGGGGLAGLAVVGRTGQKARGETGLENPTGDPFFVDYVAHEMGHQFGGNHTFSSTRGSCSGNGTSATAMEPGSGSTIMAYAGICGDDDLQPLGDDVFHAVSFDQIATYTTTPSSPGNLGASPSGNTPPTVAVNGGGAFTIPARTPFALAATGSDVDGDFLTYSWEQYDGGVLQPLDDTDKVTGPLFRSFDPSPVPTRVFPRMSSILGNLTNAGSGTCPPLPAAVACWSEFLPTTARTMRFRVTVRDNNAAAGGVSGAESVVTVANTGPFKVLAPNSAVSLPAATPQTVTWSVGGTASPPISAASVNILLSTDGGLTFPTTLAAGTPNDGSEPIVLPSGGSNQARLKIEAIGNVFFDITDADFTITSGNSPPVAADDSAAADIDTAISIDVLANDSDADGTVDRSSVTIISTPLHGEASVAPVDGVVTYTPAPGFQGSDVFMYTVHDDDGASSGAATVSITVGAQETGSAPTSFTTEAGSTVAGSAASLATDDDAFLVVRSGKSTPRVVGWFGSFTGIANASSTLKVTTRSKASVACTQVLSIWRWTDSSWVQLDSRPLGITELELADLSPGGSPGDYVSGASGPGEVRVRLGCSNASTSLDLSTDLLRLESDATGGGTGSVPTSFTTEAGSTVAGSAASLATDDDAFLVVRSGKSTPRVVGWFGSFTGIANASSTLKVTTRSKASVACTQVLSIWRWTDSSWVQLDSRPLGITELELADLSPGGSPGDYVSGASGPGEVRVRLGCSNASTSLDLSTDLLRLIAQP